MVHDPGLLDKLQALKASSWRGKAYRHMFGDYEPLLENRGGARWNPPDIPAIYTSLERETALAEADYLISLQPTQPYSRRTIYTLRVELESVLSLDNLAQFEILGESKETLLADDWSKSQEIGGAVEWLNHDGMLVPSARVDGTNLVIFPKQFSADSVTEVVDREVISE